MSRPQISVASYRLQFTPQFKFAEARAIVPYLKRLGISDIYCSPILTARPGSTHGYDVVDPLYLNPELGGQHDFDELAAEAHRHQMGLLLDIVPNHMAASSDNRWWLDVLENGPSSRYAHFFDIEWDGPSGGTLNRVLLPILGSPYGDTLESGEIRIEASNRDFHLCYFEHELPLALESYGMILGLRAGEIQRAVGDTRTGQVYQGLLERLANMPQRTSFDGAVADERRRLRDDLRNFIPALYNFPAAAAELDRALQIINGVPGEPESFDLLDQIVAMQSYRLAFWQIAREQINYRRFFDINDLVSMRVEDDDVFDAMHERVFDLVRAGQATGLRVDHVDGLWDPRRYLTRLQHRLAQATGEENRGQRFFVVVEKILGYNERLPENWPVSGTTGYDFLNLVQDLFVDGEQFGQLERIYQRTSGVTEAYAEIVYQAKRQLLEETFTAYVRSLSVSLEAISDEDRHGRDLTFDTLREAMIEVTAALPVYRTYTNSMEVAAQDRAWIEQALNQARARRPDLRHTLAFLGRVLVLDIPSYIPREDHRPWLDFVMRWQQLTGPVMAKGNEDTALYRYNCLLARNEVGGHPELPPTSIDQFHAYNVAMAERWPHTLIATSTHDTKRSEDTRARIVALSEMPEEWGVRLDRWQSLNVGKRPVRNAIPIPDANVEMQIYQSMLGAWPLDPRSIGEFQERLKAYLIKAAREAKTYTNWHEPNSVFEDALLGFVDAIFDREQSAEFLDDFTEFHRGIARVGALNSLSQLLIKFTVPGIPDVFQGNETWDFSLVDPDNRRPVDYRDRIAALDMLYAGAASREERLLDLVTNWCDGRIKLFLTHQLLESRSRFTDLFTLGSYERCLVDGDRRRHVVAYVRTHKNAHLLVIAPVLLASLVDNGDALSASRHWGDTRVTLPSGWNGAAHDLLGGRSAQITRDSRRRQVKLSDVMRNFPGALLGDDELTKDAVFP